MEKVKVEVSSNDMSDVKRAIESAKDVLFGIPDFGDNEREASILLSFNGPILVKEGKKDILPSGDYLIVDLAYKYADVKHIGDNYKISLKNLHSVKVLKENG